MNTGGVKGPEAIENEKAGCQDRYAWQSQTPTSRRNRDSPDDAMKESQS